MCCGGKLTAARVQALTSMEVSRELWTCVRHSLVRRIKGAWMGEVGSSELKLVDRLYNDSVRSTFHRTDAENGDLLNYEVENPLGDDEPKCDNQPEELP